MKVYLLPFLCFFLYRAKVARAEVSLDAFYSGAYPYEVSFVVSGHIAKSWGSLLLGVEALHADFHSYYRESAAFIKFSLGDSFRLESSVGVAHQTFNNKNDILWAGTLRPVFHFSSWRLSFPFFIRVPVHSSPVYKWRVDFFPSVGFRFFY